MGRSVIGCVSSSSWTGSEGRSAKVWKRLRLRFAGRVCSDIPNAVAGQGGSCLGRVRLRVTLGMSSRLEGVCGDLVGILIALDGVLMPSNARCS